MARHWAALGAGWLHLVDLDGAFSGKPRNFDLISRICAGLAIPVQLGGGIRDLDTAAAYLEAGVRRIIIGTMDGAEFWGDFNLLKAGIAYSDIITTVSPTYAQEILYPHFGCGLEGILGRRSGQLRGILNGADYSVWDPVHDRYLPSTYSYDDLSGKAVCKRNLVTELSLDRHFLKRPILGFIGRIRGQKGIDLLISIMAPV